MTWFLSVLLFVYPYRWVVIIGSIGSLGLLQRPLLFLSANVESIFKVPMETIVFVVAVIGAAGRARLCYFCRKASPDTRSLTLTHTQTGVCMPEYRCKHTMMLEKCTKKTSHMSHCFPAIAAKHQTVHILCHLNTTINLYASLSAVSKSFPWNLPTQMPRFFFFWGFLFEMLIDVHDASENNIFLLLRHTILEWKMFIWGSRKTIYAS